jgi:hypothetical protein
MSTFSFFTCAKFQFCEDDENFVFNRFNSFSENIDAFENAKL